MARDATARLYDVDEDTVVFQKMDQKEKYDQGKITFHARKGSLIDLEKLHESIWATRLSGGTNSGLVSLQVTAVGRLVPNRDELMLEVAGSDVHFVLGPGPETEDAEVFANLRTASGELRVTGRMDGWAGRWPTFLRERPPQPHRILVTNFESTDRDRSHE